LTGGWILLISFLLLLYDSGFLLYAAVVALIGIGFAAGGYYNKKKCDRRQK
jgi:hypothetical protein